MCSFRAFGVYVYAVCDRLCVVVVLYPLQVNGASSSSSALNLSGAESVAARPVRGVADELAAEFVVPGDVMACQPSAGRADLSSILRAFIGDAADAMEVDVLSVRRLVSSAPAAPVVLQCASCSALLGGLCAIAVASRAVHSDAATLPLCDVIRCGAVVLSADGLRVGIETVARSVNWVAEPLRCILEAVCVQTCVTPAELGSQLPSVFEALLVVASALDSAGAASFLFEDVAVDDARCLARVWTTAEGRAIFTQCRNSHQSDGSYCKTHAKKCAAASGVWRMGAWDPQNHHRSLPPAELSRAWHYAKRRGEQFVLRGHAAPACAVGSGSAGLRTQKPFVSFEADGHSALREWCEEAVPLPPHPCMLCPSAFATSRALSQHVSRVHHGGDEYRKRMFYLLGCFECVGAAKPQLWRHVVDAFTEEYVTGSVDWPPCADADADAAFTWDFLPRCGLVPRGLLAVRVCASSVRWR